MDKAVLLNDLRSAVAHLDAALRLEASNDVIKAGCIQYFEFCFELAWKTVKCMAEEEGELDCGSPKGALRYAFRRGWIREELQWLEMLSARNRMSHTYNAADALSIYVQLPGFRDALGALSEALGGKERKAEQPTAN